MSDIIQSIDILKRVMTAEGFSFSNFRLQGEKSSFVVIADKDGNQLTMSAENPLYPFATSSARLIARNKPLSYEYARRAGAAVPESVVVADRQDTTAALQLLEQYTRVIVKPVSAAGSRGLTLDIADEVSLRRAIKTALGFSGRVLVQRQFLGEEVRFVVIDGKVRAAILREKPKIVGDGRKTVAELIVQENKTREKIVDTMVPYPMFTPPLISQQLTESTDVLETGQVLELSKSTMIKGGASVYDVRAAVHDDYVAIAERAAAGLGKGFVAVDMMIQDYKKQPGKDSYVFIEFNLSSALALFYSCRDGRHFRVAEDYLVPMIAHSMQGQHDVG